MRRAGLEPTERVSTARSINTPLKNARQIQSDFRTAFRLALREPRRAYYLRALATLLHEPSFSAIGDLRLTEIVQQNADEDLNPQILHWFSSLSTGHKFAILMVTQLAAYVRDQSLVLIDEPEANLHPPLIAALLRSIRDVLTARNSNGILATHSPVILQETISQHILYINRSLTINTVYRPNIETFGEDIGTITREVFGLNSKSMDFTSVLRQLASEHNVKQIEAMFPNGLSGQARSFLVAMKARQA